MVPVDEETKSNALEKLRAMGQFIAYPDQYLDRSTMDDYYKGVLVMIHLFDIWCMILGSN